MHNAASYAWTYATDGALLATPQADARFAGCDRATLGLLPRPCLEVEGLVFVRAVGGEPIEADVTLAGLRDDLRARKAARDAEAAARARERARRSLPVQEKDPEDEGAEGADNSPHAVARLKQELEMADRQAVRQVVLRELGGADYVPPTIASLADGEDGMGMRMGMRRAEPLATP